MAKNDFLKGIRDGLPIGLGYFAVAFSLGIVARNAGLTPLQGFIASILNHASAGEYALFTSIQQGASYAEIALITLVVNARYFLMSCSLSQKFNPNEKMIHRIFVGFGITDEIFGITISGDGYLKPFYNYGAVLIALPLWSVGTACGIFMGNLLPKRIVSALSVSLYGMFLAIIVPVAKKNFTIFITILISFVLSYVCTFIPKIKDLPSGTKTIILTVLISAIVSILKPVRDSENSSNEAPENLEQKISGKAEDGKVTEKFDAKPEGENLAEEFAAKSADKKATEEFATKPADKKATEDLSKIKISEKFCL